MDEWTNCLRACGEAAHHDGECVVEHTHVKEEKRGDEGAGFP
jgi:hypothetical protein